MDILKINFHDKQLLTADEMLLEQEYHTAMRRLRNSSFHGCGIVSGLEVEFVGNNPPRLIIKKGMALVQADESFDIPLISEVYVKEDYTLYMSDYEIKGKGGNEHFILTVSYKNDVKSTIEPMKGKDYLYILEEPKFEFIFSGNFIGSGRVKLAKILINTTTKEIVNGQAGIFMDVREYTGLFSGKGKFKKLSFKPSTGQGSDNPFIQGKELNVEDDIFDNSLSINSKTIDMDGPEESPDHKTSVEINGSLNVKKNVDITGDAVIKGDYKNVKTTILGKNVVIKDNIITLNQGKTKTDETAAGIEVYRGDNVFSPKIVWEKGTTGFSWKVRELDNGEEKSKEIAFGLDELRDGSSGDNLHMHDLLKNATYAPLNVSSFNNEIKIGIRGGNDSSEILKVSDGSIKLSEKIFFPDSSELAGSIKPRSELYTHVLKGSGSNDTASLQDLIESNELSNRSILITGRLILSGPININSNSNLKIVGSPNSSIEGEDLLFNLIGNCSNIEFKNLKVTSSNTSLLQISENTTSNGITISRCSNSLNDSSESGGYLLENHSGTLENIKIFNNEWKTSSLNGIIQIFNSEVTNLDIINNTFDYNGLDQLPKAIDIRADSSGSGCNISNLKVQNNRIRNFSYSVNIENFNTGYNIDISSNRFSIKKDAAVVILMDSFLSNKLQMVRIVRNNINIPDEGSASASNTGFKLKHVGSGIINDNDLNMRSGDFAFNIEDCDNVGIANNIILKAQAGTVPLNIKLHYNLIG